MWLVDPWQLPWLLGLKKSTILILLFATTGNAGPTRGDLGQEEGTVFIGLATSKEFESFKFNMGNNRTRVIQKTVNQALELLYRKLLK